MHGCPQRHWRILRSQYAVRCVSRIASCVNSSTPHLSLTINALCANKLGVMAQNKDHRARPEMLHNSRHKIRRSGSEIQVQQDQWKTASAPDWLTTVGLGPCIAVIILNHTQKKAWLSHDSGISSTDPRNLTKMITAAGRARRSSDKIDVHILGAELSLNFIRAAVLADRKCTMQLVKKMFTKVRASWGPVDFLEVHFEKHRWKVIKR
jgi:hypothetical protein